MVARRLLAWASLLNALDLSTSLSLHGADREIPLPARPLWLLVVQLAFLPVFAWFVARGVPTVRAWFAGLAVPRSVKVAVATVLAAQLLHVFFRTEHYPFSAVTMFSDYQPPSDPGRPRRLAVFVVDGQHGPEPLSFLREGSPYFSRYLHVDYKTGWILGTFAQDSDESERRVTKLLAEAGAPRPRLATVELDPHTGTVRVLSEPSGPGTTAP